LSDPDIDAIYTLFNTSRVSITPAYLIYVEGGSDEINESDKISASFFQDFIVPGEEAMEPASDIFYPVLANAADHVSTRNKTANNDVVAILSLSVYWRDREEVRVDPVIVMMMCRSSSTLVIGGT
jgi:hypothetical protein